MRRRFTHSRNDDRVLVLSSVFPALCVYGFLVWWIHLWILIVNDFSEWKAFIFEPWFGPFHLAHVLTFMNIAWVLLLGGQAVLVWKRRPPRMWRSLIALASALLFVIVIQVWIRGFDTIADRYDNDRIRSDQEMVKHFDEQQEHFEAITSGIQEEMASRKENGSFALWEVRGDKRWRWYGPHKKKIGIRREITGSQRGERVIFVDAVNAIGFHGSIKGYLYSEKPPAPLVANLDALQPSSDAVMGFRRITGNWYLFLDKKP